ncbi:hypothetical protein MTO96_046524 [Rhipicephalus appendiculatus]
MFNTTTEREMLPASVVPSCDASIPRCRALDERQASGAVTRVSSNADARGDGGVRLSNVLLHLRPTVGAAGPSAMQDPTRGMSVVQDCARRTSAIQDRTRGMSAVQDRAHGSSAVQDGAHGTSRTAHVE